MKLIDFRKTELKDGFWKNKTDIVSEVSVYNYSINSCILEAL